MRDTARIRGVVVRVGAILALLAVTLGGPPSLSGQAADPSKELAPQERRNLEAQASELNQSGEQANQQGDLVKAVAMFRQSLQIRERLYPKDSYPRGHPYLAESLNSLGFVFKAQRSYVEARGYYERALAMYQTLYPKDRYPQGHPEMAFSLNELGFLLHAQGSYAEARGYFERALAMCQSLYPKDRHPRGHPYVAAGLNNLGALVKAQGSYVEARGYFERALAMRQSLYPRDHYPKGHPELAQSLNNMRSLLEDAGSYGEARGYYEQALAMNQSLYSKDRYPQGHPELAMSLDNLGGLLGKQGSFVAARDYLERALALYESLYSRNLFPEGHPELATSLNNLGALLDARGSLSEAQGYYKRALVMNQSLYPKDRYPQGHPHLAASLSNMGFLLRAQGSYEEARGFCERALAMNRSLYKKDRYPLGHPVLSTSLNNVGFVLEAQGSYVEAREYFERALAMERSLYPKDRYPEGHPALASSINNLGFLLQAEGSYGEAAVFLRQGTDVQQTLSRTLLAATSEAEAMSYLAQLPLAWDALISVSLRVPATDDETYRRIWSGKSALTQILHDRQAATLSRAGTDPAVRQTLAAWREARSRLAGLILATVDGRDHPERAAMIKELGIEKERLERELAKAIPEFARKQTLERSRYEDLLKVLPQGTAVVDLLRFARFEPDLQVKGEKGWRWTPGYVGFVLSKGQPVRMVDLRPAAPIDDAVSRWRQAIISGQDSPAAGDLRKLVWEPLARNLPIGATTVFLAPDGALSSIPWAALPGDRPGTVLLEQYALAVVPHAPFLLDRLTAPKPPDHENGGELLLAVGGVAYGLEPKPVNDERTRLQLLAARPAVTKRGGECGWTDLPGTLRELDTISRLAAKRKIVRLQGAEAGTARLLEELPSARWAHIATHGFFVDPSVRSVLTPDPKLFGSIGTERVGAGLRNPLVLSGLVLAGANLPRSADDLLTHDDRGILTAEAIAGLDLSGLDLAVLSACETGLGLPGGGDRVFGLQRAFHLAGAHNVVASLWKVDDQATAALMALFYERLWRHGKPPLEALREAQLALYRGPELVGKLAAARGTPDFDKLVQRPEPGPGTDGSSGSRRAAVRQWAAFVLSGDGR